MGFGNDTYSYYLTREEGRVIELYQKFKSEPKELARAIECVAMDSIKRENFKREYEQKSKGASYCFVLNGKEMGETIFPEFVLGNQTAKRLERMACLDLSFYRRKCGDGVTIRFFGYSPKSKVLRAKLYKPAQPLSSIS